jgi:hypothetical protein
MNADDLEVFEAACDGVCGPGSAARIEKKAHPNKRVAGMIVAMTGMDPRRAHSLTDRANAMRAIAVERCSGPDVVEASRAPLHERDLAFAAIIGQPDEPSSTSTPDSMNRFQDQIARAAARGKKLSTTPAASPSSRPASPPSASAPVPSQLTSTARTLVAASAPGPKTERHGRDLLIATLAARRQTAAHRAENDDDAGAPLVDRTSFPTLKGRDRLIAALAAGRKDNSK